MAKTATAPSGARRSPLNFRTTAELRAKLTVVAQANGNSLLRETEQRLASLFAEDELLGGPEGRRVVYSMGTAFLLAGQYSAGPDAGAGMVA